MKSSLNSLSRSTMIAFAAVLLFTRMPADAELNSIFIDPPYKQDESIVGTGGWELIADENAVIYNDPSAAQVVFSPVSNAEQATALGLKTGVKNTSYGEISDTKVLIGTTFAVAFNKQYEWEREGIGLIFWIGQKAAEKSLIQFGFDYGTTGGLYFRTGEEDRVIILPKKEVAQHTPYQFQITIQQDNASFQVHVIGTKEDGSPFHYTSAEIGLARESSSNILNKGIFIFNNVPTTVEAWIENVRIVAAPTP